MCVLHVHYEITGQTYRDSGLKRGIPDFVGEVSKI